MASVMGVLDSTSDGITPDNRVPGSPVSNGMFHFVAENFHFRFKGEWTICVLDVLHVVPSRFLNASLHLYKSQSVGLSVRRALV